MSTAETACPHVHPPQQPTYQEPRRRDRGVEDTDWIRDLLTRAPVGAMATADAEGPTLVPNLFVFDPSKDVIYLHSARKGETRTQLDGCPQAAFCVAEMGRLLPAPAAVNFSVEYASVVLKGTSSVVEDEEEASYALDLFMRKYAPQFEPGKDYRPTEAKDLARTSVFRIDIESWSAKGKTSQAEDAYDYPVASGCPHLVAQGGGGGIVLPTSE